MEGLIQMPDGRFKFTADVKPYFRNIADGLPKPKTVLVVGQPRGGTSAVATALDALGIYMGDPSELRHCGSFESFVFVHGTAEDKEAEAKRLNREKPLWGWKQPYGVEGLDNLPEAVHDLYCVFVFRDLAALFQAYKFHSNGTDEEVATFVSQQNAKLWKASQTTKWPSYLVSYERMKTQPYNFVMPLCEFLGIKIPMHQKAEAMARISHVGGYIQMPTDYGWPPATPPGCKKPKV